MKCGTALGKSYKCLPLGGMISSNTARLTGKKVGIFNETSRSWIIELSEGNFIYRLYNIISADASPSVTFKS